MKKRILAWLLFHANRVSRDPDFYEIKNKILSRFGKPIGYDLQEIDGKGCFHCHGEGDCPYFDCWSCENDLETTDCGKCGGSGWWKFPQRNLLLKMQFGRFVFHQPIKRLLPDEACEYSLDSTFYNFVKHNPSRYGKLALYVLFTFYRPMKFKKIYEQSKLPF